MFFKRRKRTVITKAIALFLLITILNQLVAPTVAFALTSGPTAPEATSFEPIDTTDMVNPLTGDFTYNMPLIEVPGPEGGYPLSLSYHAGIQPNEDASWVGLGWTLNPGAITRSVNGFPDDWSGTGVSKRDYWAGGVRKTWNIGVSVGAVGSPGVSFGLSFSQDSYKGFGIGVNAGIGKTWDFGGIGVGGGVNFGISPYGEGVYAGVGVNVSQPIAGNIGGSLGLGLNTNFKSVSGTASGGISYSIQGDGKSKSSASGSLLGGSISSGGGSPSFAVGGFSASTDNSKAGNISTSSTGFSFGIPIWLGVNLDIGFTKTRYWSDETSLTTTYGSLNSMSTSASKEKAYDNYSTPDPKYNVADNKDSRRTQGAAYPDFDVYNVVAQGLSGGMRPYNFQAQLLSQNLHHKGPAENDPDTAKVLYYSNRSLTSDPQAKFRFVNDFSNRYMQNNPSYANANVTLKTTAPTFDSAPVYGNNDSSYGYSQSNNLKGSKSIEYYTTNNGTVVGSGFMIPKVNGLVRSNHISGSTHIAGFKIKNASGVTYHYNLPALAYDEEITQEKIRATENEALSYNRQTKSDGYAYTWYLTSMTGPDYVDKNGNQKVDAGDWGYWINFEYGLWADDFCWRNPAQGNSKDEDNNYANVSMGKKQLYYLDKIRTRTHVALFEKEKRFDGRGSSPAIFDHGYQYREGIFDANSTATLRLNKIYLVKAEDGNFINSSPSYTDNVFDITDLNSVYRMALENRALRIIDFNYSYDLCKGTPNSSVDGGGPALGKLTLNWIGFRGPFGEKLVPPVEFEYDISNDDLVSANCTLNNSFFKTSEHKFKPGDVVETFGGSNGPIFCGVIMKKDSTLVGGTVYDYTYTLRNSQYPSSTISSALIKQTKNPAYHKDAYDMWGMYKSDFVPNMASENLSRTTTEISNVSTDVWSLRKIKTSLGSEIKIDYEGDTYSKSVLNQNLSLIITGFSKISPNIWQFTLNNNSTSVDLYKTFKPNDNVNFVILKKLTVTNPLPTPPTITYSTIAGGPTNAHLVSIVNSNTIQVQVDNSLETAMSQTNSVLQAGNLKVMGVSRYYGGGLRVKSLKSYSLSNNHYITKYSYNIPGQAISSGVTPYEPITMDVDEVAGFPVAAIKIYRKKLYEGMENLYGIAREVPPPGVMYEYVTSENQVVQPGETVPVNIPGKTVYRYEVFRSNMVGRTETVPEQTGAAGGQNQYIRHWLLKKFIASLGALKSITKYDVNNRKLEETINNYLHDGLENLSLGDFMTQYEARLVKFKYQGLIKERYSEVKEVHEDDGSRAVRATLSGRDELPAVPLGQTQINYVTGISTGTENLGFDFYSGALTKLLTKDAYGNRYLTVDSPAYKIYSQMGPGYKNMLTQSATKTTYKVDANNNYLSVVSASAQTWANNISVEDSLGVQATFGQSDIWRPNASYAWMMAGTTANNLTPYASFTNFNFSGSSVASWKKTGAITKYNVYSAALEAVDIDTLYSATKMGYNDSKVIITSTPARNKEIAYASAEDKLITPTKTSSGVLLGSATINSTQAMVHSGAKSFSLAPGTSGLSYVVPLVDLETNRRDYHVAVWVKSSGTDYQKSRFYYQVTNQTEQVITPTFLKYCSGWYLLEMKIPATALPATTNPAINLTVGCRNTGTGTIYFDDFRFQPFNASTTSYVYDTNSGLLEYILNNNNLFVNFSYDNSGRLIRVSKEVLGKSVALVKEINYWYAKPL